MVRDFKSLVEELKKITVVYKPSNYRYKLEGKLINYIVQPDHTTMSEQSVNALRNELDQDDEQARFRYQYKILL